MSEIISLILEDANERMQKAVNAIASELSRIRTGKATTALLDGIKVEAYGEQMPLNQVASIGTPEVRLLTIQPWDKTIIKDIESIDDLMIVKLLRKKAMTAESITEFKKIVYTLMNDG